MVWGLSVLTNFLRCAACWPRQGGLLDLLLGMEPMLHSILDVLSFVSMTALPLMNDKSCHGASVRFSRTLLALSIAQLGDLATVAGVKAACERENEHP